MQVGPALINALDDSPAICFGMVFSHELRSNQGQPYRDSVRLEALQQLLQRRVISCDIDHIDVEFDDIRVTEGRNEKPTLLENHVMANFNDPRRWSVMVTNKFGENITFSKMFWDYFFLPVKNFSQLLSCLSYYYNTVFLLTTPPLLLNFFLPFFRRLMPAPDGIGVSSRQRFLGLQNEI